MKINTAVDIFAKHSIGDAWRVLSIPRILNIPGFRIHYGSKYAFDFEYARVLNIPGFWICQSYTAFWIYQNNSRLCLIVPEYIGICVNMSICLNGCFIFTHCNPCLLERAVTHFNAYTKLEIIVWTTMRLFPWIDEL